MADEGEGWRMFAGVVLLVAGTMRLLDSIWAFGSHATLPDGLKDGVLGDNLTTYAWVYLITAVVLLAAGFLVFYRSQLARWIGIAAGALACVGAATMLPYYPVWSLVYIGLGVLVIFALAAHGGKPVPGEADYVGAA